MTSYQATSETGSVLPTTQLLAPTASSDSSSHTDVDPRPKSTPRNCCGCAFSNTLLAACLGLVAMSIALLVTVIMLTRGHPTQAPDAPSSLLLESQFRSTLRGENIGRHLYNLTYKSHMAGTPENYDTAIYVRDEMIAAGIPEVYLEPFDVLLSYPTQTRRSVGQTHAADRRVARLPNRQLTVGDGCCIGCVCIQCRSIRFDEWAICVQCYVE
jgi:hypothetical protein